MIKYLVTVVIPCNNSLEGLKKTLESISSQTKVIGTKVFVADLGSNDGSIQYVQQLFYNPINSIDVSPVDFIKDAQQTKGLIKTPYVFTLLPGEILDNKDFLMNQINNSCFDEKAIIYRGESFIKRVIKRLKGLKGLNRYTGVLCNRDFFLNISFEKDDQGILIKYPQGDRKKFRILTSGKQGFRRS